ncbi:MAG: hypothetical protein J6W56_05640 [Prevotella sp.]|nr:hypothetical protein [Prevotella sp.]
MKKMMTLVMMMTIAISAKAFTYAEARNEAMYLTDKMTRELHLMPAQYDAVYDINFEYLRSVNHHSHAYGMNWKHRNHMLRGVLTAHQYDKFLRTEHLYRPVAVHPAPKPGHGPAGPAPKHGPAPKKPAPKAPAPKHGHSNHPAPRR